MAKFCSNCGNKVEEGQAVCLNCGFSIKDSSRNNSGNVDPNAKSRLIAGLLGIFLGYLGIHNFYLGNNSKAITQLLISVLSCFTLAVISEIWGLIEGILLLCGNINVDGNGNSLKD